MVMTAGDDDDDDVSVSFSHISEMEVDIRLNTLRIVVVPDLITEVYLFSMKLLKVVTDGFKTETPPPAIEAPPVEQSETEKEKSETEKEKVSIDDKGKAKDSGEPQKTPKVISSFNVIT